MSQYLLSVYMVEGEEDPTPEVMESMYAQVDAFNTELQESGAWVFAGGLHPADTASVVDATKDTPTVTDGPFAEAKEQIGGFWVIEANDLDVAIELAKRASAACLGAVEVRPFQDDPAA